MDIPEDAVIRINMAWVHSKEELIRVIENIKDRDIYLDYPQGRSKPPTPTLKIKDAYELMRKYDHIKYFAVSNIETVQNIQKIKAQLPERVEFVPKIETRQGVDNINRIIDCNIQTIMLDKEDLYVNVGNDNTEFFTLVDVMRKVCKNLKVTLLELEGVIFSEYK